MPPSAETSSSLASKSASGPAVSERRNVQHDQIRIDTAQIRVIKLELAHPRPGPSEYRDVGPSEQPLDPSSLGLNVEEERALASIQRMKMCGAAFASAARRLHPDSACALFGEKHRGVGGAQVGVEFDQIDAVESFIHRGSSGAKMVFARQQTIEILTRRPARASAQNARRYGIGSRGCELPAGEFNRA